MLSKDAITDMNILTQKICTWVAVRDIVWFNCLEIDFLSDLSNRIAYDLTFCSKLLETECKQWIVHLCFSYFLYIFNVVKWSAS